MRAGGELPKSSPPFQGGDSVIAVRGDDAGVVPARASSHARSMRFDTIATVGFDRGNWEPGSGADTIFKAQMAVADDTSHPAFAGTVGSFDSTGYWRTLEESPKDQGYHYNWNAETYLLVGDAAGRKMLELLSAAPQKKEE